MRIYIHVYIYTYILTYIYSYTCPQINTHKFTHSYINIDTYI